MDQCLSENMNNNTSREIEMVTPRKSPEGRQSLIGSPPDGRPSTRTSQLPRFYGHVLGNGDAPPSSVRVCASKGWLREHEIWPLAAITQKKRSRSSMQWMLEEACICGRAHGLIMSQPGNALQGNIQVGNKSHYCLMGHPLHGLLKASKQQEGNYSLFGPCHGTTPLLQVNSAS